MVMRAEHAAIMDGNEALVLDPSLYKAWQASAMLSGNSWLSARLCRGKPRSRHSSTRSWSNDDRRRPMDAACSWS